LDVDGRATESFRIVTSTVNSAVIGDRVVEKPVVALALFRSHYDVNFRGAPAETLVGALENLLRQTQGVLQQMIGL